MKRTRSAAPAKSSAEHKADGLVLLEVSAEDVESSPKVSHVLKAAGMLENVWDYIEGSEEPEARALRDARARLSNPQARAVPFEAFCLCAKISPRRALELLAGEVFYQSSKASALLAATQHPEVTRATIEAAMTPLGTSERKMLHLHADFLPVPKTSIVNVRGNHTMIGGEQRNLVLPPVEDSVRRLGDRFNQRTLPAPATPVAQEAVIVEDEG